jgi:hypothetical protein
MRGVVAGPQITPAVEIEMPEMAKTAVSVPPEALSVTTVAQPEVSVKVGDRVLYSCSLTRAPGASVPLIPDPRLAFVTKVHAGRPGRVNLIYFQTEKGEDPVMFAEDVLYAADPAWAGHWSPLPK